MNAFDFTDAEVLAIFNKALKASEPKPRKSRKADKMNEAIADYLNLPECGFIPAK